MSIAYDSLYATTSAAGAANLAVWNGTPYSFDITMNNVVEGDLLAASGTDLQTCDQTPLINDVTSVAVGSPPNIEYAWRVDASRATEAYTGAFLITASATYGYYVYLWPPPKPTQKIVITVTHHGVYAKPPPPSSQFPPPLQAGSSSPPFPCQAQLPGAPPPPPPPPPDGTCDNVDACSYLVCPANFAPYCSDSSPGLCVCRPTDPGAKSCSSSQCGVVGACRLDATAYPSNRCPSGTAPCCDDGGYCVCVPTPCDDASAPHRECYADGHCECVSLPGSPPPPPPGSSPPPPGSSPPPPPPPPPPLPPACSDAAQCTAYCTTQKPGSTAVCTNGGRCVCVHAPPPPPPPPQQCALNRECYESDFANRCASDEYACCAPVVDPASGDRECVCQKTPCTPDWGNVGATCTLNHDCENHFCTDAAAPHACCVDGVCTCSAKPCAPLPGEIGSPCSGDSACLYATCGLYGQDRSKPYPCCVDGVCACSASQSCIPPPPTSMSASLVALLVAGGIAVALFLALIVYLYVQTRPAGAGRSSVRKS